VGVAGSNALDFKLVVLVELVNHYRVRL
jgi:hypothetical protein